MNILDFILDLLYPPRCMLCRKVLMYMEKDFCIQCGKSLPRYMIKDVRRDIKHIELCVAPFEYRDDVRMSLHRYKFNGAAAYGRVYADFIAKSIDENQISCDIITWVPLSRRGLRKRGYDQAEIIARSLAERLNLPCVKLLNKVKDTKKQSTIKSRDERQANIKDAYRFNGKYDIKDRKILLVDDIVTSGSTLEECAREIKKHGCSSIYGAAAATPMR